MRIDIFNVQIYSKCEQREAVDVPLHSDDYRVILRELQTRLRDVDSEAAVLVNRLVDLTSTDFEGVGGPKRMVLHHIKATINVMSDRSSRHIPEILERANRYIDAKGRGSIEAVTIQFSPQEQELYGVRSFDLATLPDYSDFIDRLKELHEMIQEDDGESE